MHSIDTKVVEWNLIVNQILKCLPRTRVGEVLGYTSVGKYFNNTEIVFVFSKIFFPHRKLFY